MTSVHNNVLCTMLIKANSTISRFTSPWQPVYIAFCVVDEEKQIVEPLR